MTPNQYCIAWNFSTDAPVVGIYQGEMYRPFAPFLNMNCIRFLVLRLTGETFEATAVAPLPSKLVILDDHRHKRNAARGVA